MLWCNHWQTVEDPQYDGHRMCLGCGALLREPSLEESMAQAVAAISRQSGVEPPPWAIEVLDRVEDYYRD